MANRLDAIAIGVAQERGVTGRVIIAQTRRAVVGTAGGDSPCIHVSNIRAAWFETRGAAALLTMRSST
jgi:hypothetical protein